MGIFIAIPSASGILRWSIANALAIAGKLSVDTSFPWSFAIGQCIGMTPVSEARNTLVKAFIENKRCEWLWFWDDDQDVPGNFMDILNHTKKSKVISGLVWMWKSDAPSHAKLLTAHGNFGSDGHMIAKSEPDSQEPYFVDGAGTGFLLIHRSVIEAVGENPFGMNIASLEDIHFIKRANALGHRVLVVPNVNPNHVKMLPFNDVYAYSRAYLHYALGNLEKRGLICKSPALKTDGAEPPIEALAPLTPVGVEG